MRSNESETKSEENEEEKKEQRKNQVIIIDLKYTNFL